ncbi:DUF6417 family protein [Streptomyces sp. NPDC057694]|uniref:DUF6417 family protein n=1 Tax=Streptomyces sp. NPDC057694 TaxID=3346216 RepID=UPI0036CFB706
MREASAEDQAELSAKAGRPVLWAVQVTADGWDVLLYARRRDASATTVPPEPGLQKVAMRRTDLEILKRCVALSGQLRGGPVAGLEVAVEGARFHAPSNRWIMHVDGAQMHSMAYAFFLERHGGSAAPANRFARIYGVVYPPQPLDFTPEAERETTSR